MRVLPYVEGGIDEGGDPREEKIQSTAFENFSNFAGNIRDFFRCLSVVISNVRSSAGIKEKSCSRGIATHDSGVQRRHPKLSLQVEISPTVHKGFNLVQIASDACRMKRSIAEFSLLIHVAQDAIGELWKILLKRITTKHIHSSKPLRNLKRLSRHADRKGPRNSY